MEREVGGGIGMGKTCKPKAFSFQCMTKFTTNKKKKKKFPCKETAYNLVHIFWGSTYLRNLKPDNYYIAFIYRTEVPTIKSSASEKTAV